MRESPADRDVQEVPFRLWAPGRLGAVISVAAAATAAVGFWQAAAHASSEITTLQATSVSVGAPEDAAEGEPLRFPVTIDEAVTDTPISIQVSTTEAGDAVPGTSSAGDFEAQTNVEVRFEAGESVKYVEVPTRADDEAEGAPETVELEIVDPGDLTPSQSTATGKVIDAVLTVESDGAVSEGDSEHTEYFDINLNVGFQGAVQVSYETVAGTGTADTHFESISPTVLEFASGETTKRVGVKIPGDDLYGGPDHTFKIGLTGFSGGAARGVDETTFTIEEDEPVPTITSVTTDGPVTEGDSGDDRTASFTVRMSGASIEPITLDVKGEGGTADDGSDYSLPGNQVTVGAEQNTATFDVTVLGDDVFERDENADIVVTPGENDDYVGGTAESGTLTIDENDVAPALALNDFDPQVEGTTVPLKIPVSGQLQGSFRWTATVAGVARDGSDPAEADDVDTTGMELSGTLEGGDSEIDLGILGLVQGSADEFDETVKIEVQVEEFGTVTAHGTIQDAADHLEPKLVPQHLATVLEGQTAGVPLRLWFDPAEGNNATSTEKTVAVDYTTGDGSAAAGDDFTARSGTVEFEPPAVSANVLIPTTADGDAEDDQRFTISYGNVQNATLIQASEVTITESPRTVSVGSPGTVIEGGPLGFPVSLSAQSSAPITVRLATTTGDAGAGDATPEADYTPVENLDLTFEPYQQFAMIEVPTLADDEVEASPEKVTLEILDPGAVTPGQSSATGSIVENAVTVTTDGTIVEDDSGVRSQVFEVRLPKAFDDEVTLEYQTADVTATAGVDYTASPPTALTFAASDTVKTIEVPIHGDEAYEPDETFKILVADKSASGVGDQQYTFTIEDDDDPPQIDMSGGAEVREGDAGPVTVFTLSGEAGDPIPWTASIKGVPDADSEPAGAQDIVRGQLGESVLSGTIEPGDDSIAMPGLVFVADGVDEHDESIEVTIDAGVAGTATALVRGSDSADEAPPGLVIPAEVSVMEGADASIPIELDFAATPGNKANSTEKTLHVEYTIAADTAIADDYTGTTGTLEIKPGETEAEITIPTVADDQFEASESFTVTYSTSDGLDPLQTTTASTTVTVKDAVPAVEVGDAVAVPEGNVLRFPVTLAESSTSPVSVLVGTTGGTAVGDDDYTTVTGQEVLFAPGDTTKTVEVTTNVDATEETVPETVVLEVTDAGNATTGQATGTGKIVDGVVTVTPVGEITEGDTGVRNQVFDVKLNIAVDAEVRLDYQVLADTATAGADFEAVAPGRLVFAPNQTEKQITVPITGDSEDEGAGESFKIVLSNLVGLQAAGVGEHSFTITDDEGLPAVVSVTGGPAREGDSTAPATFTVTLSNPAVADIVLDVTGEDDTAVQAGTGIGSADYSVPSTVTVPQGEKTGTFDVTVKGDTVFESDEKASIVVTPRDSAAVSGGAQSATLSLTNDDDPPQITVDAAPAFETAGGIPIRATVTGQSQKPIPWTVSVTGATDGSSDAAEEDDFTQAGLIPGGTLSPGATSIDLGTITPVAGSADEHDETVRVRVSPEALPDANGYVTIKDSANHLPPAVTVPGAVSVTEPGAATVPVTLDFAGVAGNAATSTEKAVTVDYTLTPGAAAAGTDYTDAPVQLSFPPSTTRRDITVPTVSDAVAEAGGEDFKVGLTSAANATIGAASATTVTINDPAAAPAHTFTVTSEVSATEGQAGPAEITVSLDAPATEDVDFTVSATDESARRAVAVPGGDDFSTPSSILRILKDQRTAKITVPVLNDEVFEEDEIARFTVEVASAETAAAGPAQVSTLLIRDDDPVPTISLNTATGAEGGTVDVIATPTGIAEDPIGYLLKLGGAGTDPAESSDYVDTRAATVLPGGSTAPVTLRSIQLTSDAIDEASETIKAILENLTAPAQTPVESTYTITDDAADMPPVVSLGAATSAESAGSVDVPVTLTYATGNGATSTERPISVGVRALPLEADASDFGAPSPNPLVIPAGQAGGTIRVPITDDTQYESPESFLLQTADVTPGEAAPQVASAFISITDDDAAPAFTVTSNVSAMEDAGVAKVTIELDAPAPDAVDFTLGMRDDTATGAGTGIGGDDYDLPVTTAQIPKGGKSVTVDVPIKPDKTYEGDEKAQITVALVAGEKDATGGPREATLTITDDDAKPTIKLTPVTVVEGASTVVTAVVIGEAQREFDLGAPAVSGDGGAGDPVEQADYELGLDTKLPAGTVSGSTVSLGDVRLVADTIDEMDEGFTLSIGDATLDFRVPDDPADVMPTVSITDVTAGESDGTADLTVSLDFSGDTTATEKTVTVPWKTVDGSAKVSKDYRGADGTVTIKPAEGSATVSVPLIGDTQDEDDQLFLVRLGAPSPAGVTVEKSDGKVTLEDDDKPKAPTLNDPADPAGAGKVFIKGVAPAGEKVELLSAPGPSGGTFRVVLTTETNSDGAYWFSPTFKQGARVQVRSGKLISPIRTIQVKQEPEIKASSPSRRTVRITVTGDPDRAGQAVTVQQQDGGGWDTVATGRLDEDGKFVTTERALRPGRKYVYRATIAATPSAGILAGRSPSKTIKVK
ncbi:Calx-beta domain-containing protein [Actinoplanes sp. NEAU-A12]|uniref:Calx-beta domain-containing protein n=1 Tax=Actinoplanes sandaracinus TaxID=3045177 RepID=A0ABT6WNH7_9ACTN|nr:Calx-beta domain-containing protein [Actinoplanes sandaracinus]MDI6101312.1 Calx-beta domain-containing protein [Actinoplanes sandaracinus]